MYLTDVPSVTKVTYPFPGLSSVALEYRVSSSLPDPTDIDAQSGGLSLPKRYRLLGANRAHPEMTNFGTTVLSFIVSLDIQQPQQQSARIQHRRTLGFFKREENILAETNTRGTVFASTKLTLIHVLRKTFFQ